MSALARWFKANGYWVGGYDKTPSPLTDTLIAEGIEVNYDDAIESIPSQVDSATLIIFTPAIPQENVQKNYLRTQGCELMKRAEVLGLITRDYFTIAVAGTHGKTTTSSMVAHLLKTAGKNVTAFLGGITNNYQSNLIYDTNGGENQIVVVEADEFDRSFLHLSPNIALVTATDADHLDIYQDDADFQQTFKEFVAKLPKDGQLIQSEDVTESLTTRSETTVYGLHQGAILATEIQAEEGAQTFTYSSDKNKIESLKLYTPGYHNIKNAIAAIRVAELVGVSKEDIQRGLETYAGVRRRFEYVYRSKEVVYIDDYAHHPTEINAFIESVRGLYPSKKLTVIFQPHLFTRTRDFMDAFAESLSKADEVSLLPIYPARELPIDGVDAEALLDKITNNNKAVIRREDILKKVQSLSNGVIATLGAGDIDRLVPMIKKKLEEKIHV